LQELATSIEQLAHRAYPSLLKDYIRREAGKAFTDGVEDPAIEIHLLLGGEKVVNKALRQALEPQAVLLAAKPQKMSSRIFWGSWSLQPGKETKDHRRALAVGSRTTSRVTTPMGWRQKTTAAGNEKEEFQERDRNRREGLNGNRKITGGQERWPTLRKRVGAIGKWGMQAYT
jgi:hypothetical protein